MTNDLLMRWTNVRCKRCLSTNLRAAYLRQREQGTVLFDFRCLDCGYSEMFDPDRQDELCRRSQREPA